MLRNASSQAADGLLDDGQWALPAGRLSFCPLWGQRVRGGGELCGKAIHSQQRAVGNTQSMEGGEWKRRESSQEELDT